MLRLFYALFRVLINKYKHIWGVKWDGWGFGTITTMFNKRIDHLRRTPVSSHTLPFTLIGGWSEVRFTRIIG